MVVLFPWICRVLGVRILFTELFGAADISEKKMHVFICIYVHFRYSAIILLMLNVEVDFYSLFWYLSVTVALQCVVWWSVVTRLMREFSKLPNLVVQLSKLSFGIYLVHILVMRNVLWQISWMQNMNGIVQIFVCTILTFIISAAVSWCLSKIPYVRAIIGC